MNVSDLESSAEFYSSAIGQVNMSSVVSACARLNADIIERMGRPTSGLFLGLGEGGLVEMMASRFKRAVVVEASISLLESARARLSHLESLVLVHERFETYTPGPGISTACLLANHVLEHLEDPVSLIQRSRTWVDDDGFAVFTVPNATSLHRRIGVAMGLLSDVYALGPQDLRVGHKRVYDLASLRHDVMAGHYEIAESGGFNVKLVSQEQMVGWPASLHEAIYAISRDVPAELCSNVYVVGRPCRD